MSEKKLESVRDLKEGMKVYIRDDLRGAVRCGGNRWVSVMAKGIVEFDDFEPEDRVSPRTGRKYKDGYRYTDEMIDWDKTNELNGISKKERSNQDKKGENKMTKEEFLEKYANTDIRVVCYTREKSDEFLKIAEKFGAKWRTGHRPTDFNYFNEGIGKIYYTVYITDGDVHIYKSNESNPKYEEVEFESISKPAQSNFIKLLQVKAINSKSDNHLLYGTFIQVDEKTIIYTEDNRIAVSHCHPDDEFNIETGKALAYYRWAKGE